MSLINILRVLIIIVNIPIFNNMKWLLAAICIFISAQTVDAQPRLDIRPHDIEFEDMFNRLELVYFINEGDEPLVIQNITYGNYIYFLRFDGYARYPFTINPGDSVKMDCILAGYLYVASVDTVDTMFVYNNGVNPIEDAHIKIDYFDDDYRFGTLNGYVTDGTLPINDAVVNFFYEGTFVIDTAHTDAQGHYVKELPPGSYIAAAEKPSYYVSFHDSSYDPFTAKSIRVTADSVSAADIRLNIMQSTGISVEGKLIDSIANTYLLRGAVVIRKGTHNPAKPVSGNIEALPGEVYTAFVSNDGTYHVDNIIDADYYYIQSFSDYYVPAYYTAGNTHPAFWQQADSIYISTSLSGVNIPMPRDSSIGGGFVGGSVSFGDPAQVSDVMIFVESLNNNLLYSYGLADESGSFNLSFLPYGTYRLIGSKLGYDNAYSGPFVIDPAHTDTTGLILIFDPLSADNPVNPETMQLLPNYPNPFNPVTTIEFTLPAEREISLILYNILGEEIKVLQKSTLREGRYTVKLDGADLPSGIYIVTLRSESQSLSRKIVLMK